MRVMGNQCCNEYDLTDSHTSLLYSVTETTRREKERGIFNCFLSFPLHILFSLFSSSSSLSILWEVFYTDTRQVSSRRQKHDFVDDWVLSCIYCHIDLSDIESKAMAISSPLPFSHNDLLLSKIQEYISLRENEYRDCLLEAIQSKQGLLLPIHFLSYPLIRFELLCHETILEKVKYILQVILEDIIPSRCTYLCSTPSDTRYGFVVLVTFLSFKNIQLMREILEFFTSNNIKSCYYLILTQLQSQDYCKNEYIEYVGTQWTNGGKIFDFIDPNRTLSCPFVDFWIPTEVKIMPNGCISFGSSEIVGVARWDHDFRFCLEQLLECFLPLFSELEIDFLKRRLGVIVKGVCYEFQSEFQYEGTLHREGFLDEEIVGVGLYYPHIDVTLRGGGLEFLKVVRGGCGARIGVTQRLSVAQGIGIAFRNLDVFHRLDLLKGKGKRIVIGFFIVDLEKRNISPRIQVNIDFSAYEYLLLLEKKINIQLPQNCRNLIMKYIRYDACQQYKRFSRKRRQIYRENGLEFMVAD